MVHLVYCDNTGRAGSRTLDRIMSGEKTMVVRGAAGRKIPHSRVFEGEMIYFMEKGTKEISASARVKAVYNYTGLSDEAIEEILDKFSAELSLTDKQRERWHKKCLCLTAFENVQRIDPPLLFDKQSNMDDWLILEKIEDALVGTSIPYNYEKSKLKG
ncbi:MAG: hypothetical protein GX061_07860 [Eubacteriaceae bacterium]|nr:hypothetical protein [Eubacteriaceae bacterium]